MDRAVYTIQVALWTLALTVTTLGFVLAFFSIKRGQTSLLRPLVYLLLLGVALLGVATAAVVGGIRASVLSLGIGAVGLGILGLLAGVQYLPVRRFRLHSIIIVGVGALGVLAALSAPSSPTYSPTGIQRLGNLTEQGVVTRVVDGDTIIVSLGGLEQRLRYIGMDTPETVHPTKPVECFGKEASNFNKRLVEGETVWLERDISEVDIYDRLLRYVWLDDEMVNAILVREGYARVATFPPDVRYTNELLELQRLAYAEDKGLWKACPEYAVE